MGEEGSIGHQNLRQVAGSFVNIAVNIGRGIDSDIDRAGVGPADGDRGRTAERRDGDEIVGAGSIMTAATDWISLAEAAAILAAANVKFRASTIGAWARTGKLQSIKLGGRRFVRRGEVRALIAPPRRVRADALQPGLFEDVRN